MGYEVDTRHSEKHVAKAGEAPTEHRVAARKKAKSAATKTTASN